MVKASDVLREAVREAALLANGGGSLEELQALANLARDALNAGDGEMDDDVVRGGGLHATGLSHLGL
jgi:hypothetical protein